MHASTLALRPYQEDVIQAVGAAWTRGILTPAVVLPTGTGKTVIFADLARRDAEIGGSPLILVHRDELVRQTMAKIHDAAPGMSVGVVQGDRQEHGRDITVASVQTVSRPNRIASAHLERYSLVIVDEAHHAAADSYLRVMAAAENALFAGFTATLARQDGRPLGAVWGEVVYSRDILDMIADGYLVDVRGRTVPIAGLDLDDVTYSRGDYQEGALGQEMEAHGAGPAIAAAYREHASREDGTLRPGVMFAPTVATAHSFGRALEVAGIPTAVITGETPTEDRQLAYKRVRAGEITVLSSCMVLTEGFDLPEMEVAVIARPTSSAALYVQMVGRVLRPAPWGPKRDALVLDVVGATSLHRLATIADLTPASVRAPEQGETLGEAVARTAAEEADEKVRKLAGRLAAENVDLFHRSRSVWLRTPGGCWFIPTRTTVVFLWPTEDGRFQVGCTGSAYAARGGTWLHDQQAFPLETAMAWGEQRAAELDELAGTKVASKTASWRQGNRAPSEQQISLAAKLRIDVEGLNKREVSDAISTHYASRMFDKKT